MPLYKKLAETQWQDKIGLLKDNFSPCRLCPRQCNALRQEDKAGVCLARRDVKIASCNLHQGEEPPISGRKGSGTFFFSGCTLKCLFCQNYPISHLNNGTFYSIEELAGLMLDLQARGAHNINLVSPTPYLAQIAEALYFAVQQGLVIPIVYNTSGYERPEIIKILNGLIDIYMPDLKYLDNKLAQRFSGVSNYIEYASPALVEMYCQVGDLIIDEEGIASQGMILRHLILPGQVENSRQALKSIAQSPFKNCYLSLMSQYFPAYKAKTTPGLEHHLLPEEYSEVKEYAVALGFNKGWFQDMD